MKNDVGQSKLSLSLFVCRSATNSSSNTQSDWRRNKHLLPSQNQHPRLLLVFQWKTMSSPRCSVIQSLSTLATHEKKKKERKKNKTCLLIYYGHALFLRLNSFLRSYMPRLCLGFLMLTLHHYLGFNPERHHLTYCAELSNFTTKLKKTKKTLLRVFLLWCVCFRNWVRVGSLLHLPYIFLNGLVWNCHVTLGRKVMISVPVYSCMYV